MYKKDAFNDLQAPVERVTGFDTTMPYYRMEDHYIPGSDDIVKAAIKALAFSGDA